MPRNSAPPLPSRTRSSRWRAPPTSTTAACCCSAVRSARAPVPSLWPAEPATGVLPSIISPPSKARAYITGLRRWSGTSATVRRVALVGGGNSACQAVVYLAGKVTKLWLIVRGSGLEATMSRYLVERIAALTNVELVIDSEVVLLEGQDA